MNNPLLTRAIGAMLSLALCAIPTRAREALFQKTDRGIALQVKGAHVELSAVTPGAFCLSISYQGNAAPSATTFIAPQTKDEHVTWREVHQDALVGISSAAGKLLIDPQTGKWTLENAQGDVVIPPSDLAATSTVEAPGKKQVPGLDFPVAWKSGSPIAVYGCGDGVGTLEQSDVHTRLGNGTAIIPYYWSPNGYAVLAVTANDNAPAYWTGADPSAITWHFPGASADLYLMPAATLKDASRDYERLSGLPPMPPLWTFGYLQSRWGWKDRAYIEATLAKFHELHIPVDAFIFDFEWYAVTPDYKLAAEGTPEFQDFGWNPALFPDPTAQLAAYRREGVHFVGIRKPRIGNSANIALFKEKGWLLPNARKGYHERDINYADPDVRAWYADQSQALLKSDIGGWWNDEGESTFTTFFHWNQAEVAAFDEAKPDQRFWSLNRSFSPGLQRLGATVWTGDVKTRWDLFQRTCTDLLNYSVAGTPFCGCDIGGFMPLKGDPELSPELLTRWMEAGTFFPIMRTHSDNKVTPHFPWLFGPEAQAAITKAIDLRYRLIPYFYSLAYETHDTGVPMMRPLVMDFPHDAAVANLSDQWTMGAGLMVAPVMVEGATSRQVYLPAGTWYPFEGNTSMDGGKTITASAKLDEVPLYVAAGTILPLGPVVEDTDAMPGGPLNLEIYPGKDAEFTLTEDDGDSKSYLKGVFRKTHFTWNDATRQLSWTTEGSYDGSKCFRQMSVTVYDPAGKKTVKAPLDSTGSVHVPSV